MTECNIIDKYNILRCRRIKQRYSRTTVLSHNAIPTPESEAVFGAWGVALCVRTLFCAHCCVF